MSEQAPVDRDSPLWQAWERYAATEDFKNSKTWAAIPAHTEGSLWAAFCAGYAAAQEATPAELVDRVEPGDPYMQMLAALPAPRVEPPLPEKPPRIGGDGQPIASCLLCGVNGPLVVWYAGTRAGVCESCRKKAIP